MADVSVRTVGKSDSYEKAGLGPEVRSGAISGAEAERRVRDPDAPRPPSRVQQLEMQVEAQALVIADVLRTGGTACTLGGTVKAPSTLGTFLRSFRWGHVRQLDRVSRELLARARAGPGDSPLTIDLDSTICETYGLAKEGARHHGYTGKRGYHPLLAVAAGTGDVLMSRLREGRANTARGAAHFLRETVGRVRYCGARGQLTVRTDSGFYTHAVVAVCRRMDVRFSIAIRQRARLHNLISRRYPKMPGRRFLTGWTVPPMWPRPPAPPSRPRQTPRRYGSSSGG